MNMTKLPENQWLTEIHPGQGSAFSLQITDKLLEEQTPYQKLAVYHSTHFGNVLTLDGLMQVTTLDNFLYHEMMSHPALFVHEHPQRVVIIGGGDCGTLKEVLKHKSVKHATQVEIDERVTQVSLQYFPELATSNHDPRAELKFDDGIKWMDEADDNSVDVIIIDSSDPIGPGEGLFNAKFYRSCHRVLRDGGILVQQSESPLLHQPLIKSICDAMDEAGFSVVQPICFPQPCYPSGWWSCTLARKGKDLKHFREHDVEKRDFDTRYYTADIHRGAFALPPFLAEFLRT
jgi:spermidine synthase